MRNLITLSLLAVGVAACASVTPKHAIPVRPDYIKAGVQVGDTVEITTVDGTKRTIEVTAVGSGRIDGSGVTIPIGDIEEITKRAWTAPNHPCGAGVPVGCSIPEVVLLSTDFEQQAKKFHPACVRHDFCYRHGSATYGVAREQCDSDFYDDMKRECKGTGGLGILDVKDYSICQLAASQTYEAVRRHGEKYYRTTTSSVCEYRAEP